MRPVKAMSRAGRENQIKMAIMLSVQRGQGDELTAFDIARKIDLHPNAPSFRFILSGMVASGQLKCREVKKENRALTGGKAFLYSLHDGDQPKKREIAVKANGRQVGQLELF